METNKELKKYIEEKIMTQYDKNNYGGHADGEYDLYSVAVREVSEETGLDVVPLIDNSIFALQALPIKGHVKKEKYVSAHIHYDILYLLVAKNRYG